MTWIPYLDQYRAARARVAAEVGMTPEELERRVHAAARVEAEVRRGIEQAERGELRDLGSFARYAREGVPGWLVVILCSVFLLAGACLGYISR